MGSNFDRAALPAGLSWAAARTRHAAVARFLEDTQTFADPLDYSAELTVEEARYWLRSERLRELPPPPAFVNRGSPACDAIARADVFSNSELERILF